MQRAFEYQLYLNKEQASVLLETLETLRHLYNNALAQRIDTYRYEQTSLGYVQQANQLPALKKKANPLAAVYSQVAQDALRRLDRAYQAFFRRVKAGEKPGFPRFKSVGRYRSCEPLKFQARRPSNWFDLPTVYLSRRQRNS